MTTMINPHANGHNKRASLNEQINRLDSMLDGLSDGLNEAVADAVRSAVGAAVKEAVQAVLTEVLTNPEIRARFQHASAGPAEEPNNNEAFTDSRTIRQHLNVWCQRVRVCIRGLRAACAGPMQKLRTSASKSWRWACEQYSALCARCDVIRPFKYQILLALGIGMLVAIAVAYAGPWLAALVGGIGGFVATLAVQAYLWLRKFLALDAEQAA